MATQQVGKPIQSRAEQVDLRSDVDSLYVVIGLGLVVVAAVAWLSESAPLLIGAVLICLVGTSSIVVMEVHELLRGRVRLGPLVVIGGTVFWFLLDATVIGLATESFTSRYLLYPHFSAGIPLDLVGKTLFGVQLFLLMAILGLQYGPRSSNFAARLAARRDRFAGWVTDAACVLVALLAYVPMLVGAGGDPYAAIQRLLEMRNLEATQHVNVTDPGLWVHLALLGLFGGSLATARFVLSVRGSRGCQLTAMTLTTVWVFLGGTRFQMVFLILPTMILLVGMMGSIARATHLRAKAAVITLVVGLAILSQAALRDSGFGASSGPEVTSKLFTQGAVGYEHFEAMAIAIDLADHRGEYFKEFLLPVVVTHFVPRAWWPDKPPWESWTYFNDVVTAGTGAFNVTPSITGQYYLNWGFWGIVFIGFVLGWVGRFCDEWLRRADLHRAFSSAVFCGFFLGFIFVSFRILSAVYIAFVIGAAIVFFFLTVRSPPVRSNVAFRI